MVVRTLVSIAICLLSLSLILGAEQNLTANPTDVLVEINETTNITYQSRIPLVSDVQLYLNYSEYINTTDHVTLAKLTGRGVLPITGRKPISLMLLEVTNCTTLSNTTKCDLNEHANITIAGIAVSILVATASLKESSAENIADAFVRVSVIRSHLIQLFTIIVGWMYFFAWSLSFYPQIILNFRRKSVTGLNFDFLLLNMIGFAAYSLYNLFMYFDPNVQARYKGEHPKSPIPVLLNDVVFAVHAFMACVVTAVQCFIYERDNQRVSKSCFALASLLVFFAFCSAIASVFDFINILQFVVCFSYIKMAVTLSKYFPQTFFNFKRKSTVGWSIGNVLLDFTGGTLDILQMVLQCVNVDDWVAFYGNPVKFGLGLVSIFFDIIFMIQHYVLYKGVKVVHAEYEGIENPIASQNPESVPDHGSINRSQDPILHDNFGTNN